MQVTVSPTNIYVLSTCLLTCLVAHLPTVEQVSSMYIGATASEGYARDLYNMKCSRSFALLFDHLTGTYGIFASWFFLTRVTAMESSFFCTIDDLVGMRRGRTRLFTIGTHLAMSRQISVFCHHLPQFHNYGA
ncbi:hypothetical protein BU24DRAFT_194854 [Aaosphaeria arxii CBS 175.79]|uniref:Uncharacterized protein n=1 Tax=Aaosphaeria arxii CBS 175.79 TaxID=1450172 RepID=A0A6A5XU16_9PLEO|nr:uncharacterized protein BU24DRAFT_194854 [Aaosphaeria arxii CBS 175.79]KAF2016150.1 hypothetical protein BU24DRAFT_194854 [Aaosphaeria arxii CBS 175.79]